RRSWIWSATWLLFAAISPWTALQSASAEDRYANLPTEKYLGAAEIAATVEEKKFFTEGPAADAQGDLFFTNVYANRILKFTVKDRTLTVARENSNAANGLAFDREEKLLACEGGTEDRGQVTLLDLRSGKVSVLADSFEGKPLGAPNDLCLDATGRIYFTSRSVNPETANVNSVYRIDRRRPLPGFGPQNPVKLSRILAAPDIDMPNGIEVSADGKWLYLVESDGRADRSRCIKRYELHADGTVGKGTVLINFYPGRSGDGLCLDADGNLYIAAGLHKTRGSSETLDTKPGIHVFTPEGKLVGYVATPEDTITNCAFGGPDRRTLFVTCSKYLLQIPAKIGGAK
ncbi:MAG: gnl 1, partial [Planctomycetaceae bacterium]|nr:gnl 1 [Planctomycetaceae bacterium]